MDSTPAVAVDLHLKDDALRSQNRKNLVHSRRHLLRLNTKTRAVNGRAGFKLAHTQVRNVTHLQLDVLSTSGGTWNLQGQRWQGNLRGGRNQGQVRTAPRFTMRTDLSESEDVVFGKGPATGEHGTHATSLRILYNGTPSKSQQQQQQQQQQRQLQQQPKFQFQTLVFKVELHCDACLRKVKKAISQIDGVETISSDAKLKRVTVTGYFDPQKVLKKVAKTGKQVELITGKDAAASNASNQNNNASSSSSNNNSNLKPLNTTENNMRFKYAHTDNFTTAFSDENVNSCTVM